MELDSRKNDAKEDLKRMDITIEVFKTESPRLDIMLLRLHCFHRKF